MMKKTGGLGKGLGSLLDTSGSEDIITLKLAEVEPNANQPRKKFDEEQLKALASSIQEHGLLQPIIVSENEHGFYTIIAGERRWRASKLAGLTEIPAIVKKYTPQEVMEIALVENLQREDLNAIEEAEGYRSLMDTFHLTQEEIGKRVGKSRSAVANSLRLLNLPEAIWGLIADNAFSGGHARALLALNNKELQLEAAKKIIDNRLSVRETEQLVKTLQEKAIEKVKKKKSPNYNLLELEKQLSGLMGTKIHIKEGKNKGKIEIEYYGQEEYHRLVNALFGKKWN